MTSALQSAPPSRAVREYLRGKRVMVTGACGTVGRELVDQLLGTFDVELLIGIDHNESELVFLEERHAKSGKARFLLCDMRDGHALLRETRHVQVLFHTAAYKHVYICERSPLEAVQTNILGVQNVVQAATENGLQRLVFTSSDKAVNPTNVMGTSKLMGERLITAAATYHSPPGSVYLSTRFGNVLGSRGSVIPIFRDQIRNGGPITLSDPGMTRFVMSLDEAVRFVVESAVLGEPGDVLIRKMPAIRITDLAAVLVREYAPRFDRRPEDIEIRTIGPKPGEKIYEELMNQEETRRSFEEEGHFVIRPAITTAAAAPSAGNTVEQPYNSANIAPLSQAQLTKLLYDNQLIDD